MSLYRDISSGFFSISFIWSIIAPLQSFAPTPVGSMVSIASTASFVYSFRLSGRRDDGSGPVKPWGSRDEIIISAAFFTGGVRGIHPS